MNRNKVFSWSGLALAPLPVPLLFAIFTEMSSPGANPGFGFVLFFTLAGTVSYGMTACLLVPILWTLSCFRRVTMVMAGAVGAAVSVLGWCPLMWMLYQMSGDNSGPPQESFLKHLQAGGLGVELLGFVAAGSLTALLYRCLANRASRVTATVG